MIGIIGAMRIEMDGLKALLSEPRTETISGVEFVSGRLGGAEVVAAVSGVGKVFAALCAQTMILRYNVSAIINTGIAGTLCPELGIGDVAVSTQVVQHDIDTCGTGDPVGMISGLNQIYLSADPELARRASAAVESMGIRCVLGPIATGDQFLTDEARKHWIHDTFGAVAVEMEGGSIGQVCHVNGVPFVVLRAISDDADGNATDNYAAFAARMAEVSVAVTAALVKGMSHEQRMDQKTAQD